VDSAVVSTERHRRLSFSPVLVLGMKTGRSTNGGDHARLREHVQGLIDLCHADEYNGFIAYQTAAIWVKRSLSQSCQG
jgi:hypothetical protein